MLPYPQDDITQFFEEHQHADVNSLALKANGDPKILWMLGQLKSRNRIRKKLPSWYNRFDLILPPEANLSQSSSEATAQYKSKYVQGTLLDLTLGSGIDFWKMSSASTQATGVEPNAELLKVTAHNLESLGTHATLLNKSAEEFLRESTSHFNTIFIDPSRKADTGQKTVALHRMTPYISELWNDLLNRCDRLVIKLSPLFDLKAVQTELSHLKSIEVVSFRGEVKEVLVVAQPENPIHPEIRFVELFDHEPPVEYGIIQPSSEISYTDWQTYLYLPSSGSVKAGLAQHWASNHGLSQILPNIEVFTANHLIEDYPGRKFKILEVTKPYKNSNLPQRLSIVTRSYIERPEQIRKKLKVGESEENFLFALGKSKNHRVFIYATRVS